MVSELPVKTDTIVVSKDIHLEQISKVLNINIEHLRNLNPQYHQRIEPSDGIASSIYPHR